ncbi:hypothetical protein F9U64_00105 [Gracilibacillus oryzae]|uniref:Uncharacterized protein n=1 Tax=Gracilibacillus oryzae TaxID=1672701 RepID=A0A7C8GVV2_9BACI|nr:hypothetical protein [Gracilibacillus oryzae]KAB8139472.1 hypothetical protein F9U64_00105 [Gracilibacillus oryzae]
MYYQSDFINVLSEENPPISPLEGTLEIQENLFQGFKIVDMNGNVFANTVPSAAGGETIHFANGETAHVRENIEGGTTFDFVGLESDITTRPSIFDQESVYQNGEYIGTLKPNFMGDGINFTAPDGQNLFSVTNSSIGGEQIHFNSSLFDTTTASSNFDLANSFSEVEAVTSQFSMADLGGFAHGMDGIDMLGLF